MAERMHRTQILFPESEYRRLRQAAHDQRRSVGSLVREAVAKQLPSSSRQKRIEAAQRLVKMRLPVKDWPEMEEEIARQRGALCEE